MRKILFISILFSTFSMALTAQTNAEKLNALLGDIVNVGNSNVNPERPISNYNLLSLQQADTMYVITKSNIQELITIAKKYDKAIITVGRHTIVRIDDWTNCIQSGSWGVCMPKGKGFIQRGIMEEKDDYINNIIGQPDGQRRTLFLFN